ncbi:MAG: asparagine synthase (glutamine-hydrolyzing) [Syntrophales bacterium]
MCGICGKLNFDGKPVDEAGLRKMAAVLAHRGPDDEGVFLSNREPGRESGPAVGLAHRRLSIIDLSAAGRQPMANEDRTIWMVFNGEIYNFQSLREGLEKRGHRFLSLTDGEVILHLFEEEGIDCAKKLEGMFAFALWDEKARTLYLCRDRIGIKPLVYSRIGDSFLFASEIRGILEDPCIPREMDWAALDLYFTFNYIPAPDTAFSRIRKLMPGHYLIVRDGQAQEKSYWALQEPSPAEGGDLEFWKKELYKSLEGAVRSHLIADVAVGAFLSGGIDSSIVVALMSLNSSRPVRTYSIGYADMPMYDETRYSRAVARMYGTDHHEILLTSREILDAVPAVLDSFDEPFGDSSAVPTFIVSRETARHVKTALSGDGGDELFAGYRMYAGEDWYRRYRRIPEAIRRNLIEPLVFRIPDSRNSRIPEYVRRMKKFLRGAEDSFESRFFTWNQIFSRDLRAHLLTGDHGIDYDTGLKRISARLDEFRGGNLDRMLYADIKESLPGDMLKKVDSMSMLHSLEVRVPLLDRRVCETAFRMNGKWKMHRGRGKFILIETFKDLLPRSLHRRPKWGFEMPVSKWLKADLRYFVDEELSEGRIRRQGVFDFPTVRGLVDELNNGKSDVSWLIWSLIVFQKWHGRYVDRRQ